MTQQCYMRLVHSLVEMKAMFSQAKLQIMHELGQLWRHHVGGGIHDMIVSPVACRIEDKVEGLSLNLPCCQLQGFQPVQSHLTQEHQRGMQGIGAHSSSAAYFHAGSAAMLQGAVAPCFIRP